jgi:putative transcriptional regulator
VQPAFLIASPQLSDPFFERTVVLVWHHDADGAMGVVVNRPIDHSVVDLLELEDPDVVALTSHRVAWGGPVDAASGTVLTPQALAKDEGWILPGLSISHSRDVLDRLIAQGAPLLLCLGYAGWGPGQLDEELAQGGWLFTDVDPQLVFDTPADELYDRALATLGLDARSVWMRPIDE